MNRPFRAATPVGLQHQAGMEATYDESTLCRLAGIGVREGWRCRQIGEAGGAVTRWLTNQVGPHGEVVVTKIGPLSPAHADQHEDVSRWRHDTLTGPASQGRFDLIHVRFALAAHPSRVAIIRHLVAGLAPGGWLVIEELAPGDQVVMAATLEMSRLFHRVRDRVLDALSAGGHDLGFAREAPHHLRKAGLAEVSCLTTSAVWRGGEIGTKVLAATGAELAEDLLTRGLLAADLQSFLELLDDPGLVLSAWPLISTAGRRPGR
ncbi:class I SAM-dependent methyltransferase [Lentzea sp. NBRC 102530]|uniref:class I SAM-dependent methyltransferase n=1 Tax=Lentzea sp. NBRC 102530 TaxID=3032201 RepID=UPI00255211FB|nr:class I SAM-dependent methyltransferase [Lentzea sp. NBRC 102530]